MSQKRFVPISAFMIALVFASPVGATASLEPSTSLPNLTDLFHQLDARLPHGDYRIPSLVTTRSGTLLALIAGRFHRTDITPNIIYMRRSVDSGATWSVAVPILSDPANHTMYSGAPVVDPTTGKIHFIFSASHFRHCDGCPLHITTSGDDGMTWSTPAPLTVHGPANATWGGPLASGIALTTGPHAGRLLVALRHDCGCGTLRTSFAVYSDDHGASWTGGAEMVLLPQYGGGWTECQVAELRASAGLDPSTSEMFATALPCLSPCLLTREVDGRTPLCADNGSVLLASRNFYGRSSGQGPRLFARSDDGGATWAANWSAGSDLPGPYCEASVTSDVASGDVYLLNPSSHRRENFSVHVSGDGGHTWPRSDILYPGAAAYSDVTWTREGALGFVFERDDYNTVAFGVWRPPEPAKVSRQLHVPYFSPAGGGARRLGVARRAHDR